MIERIKFILIKLFLCLYGSEDFILPVTPYDAKTASCVGIWYMYKGNEKCNFEAALTFL
jgi:hypothetical protein